MNEQPSKEAMQNLSSLVDQSAPSAAASQKRPGPPGPPGRWEWLPVAGVAALAAAYFLAPAGSTHARLILFVGLGLLPGVLCRLAGRRSWPVHRVAFAAALVAFVLDNPALRPDRATLNRLGAAWPLVVAGFAASLTQPLWGALRTERLLVDSGVPIGFAAALKLSLIGAFFNLFLPGSTGGDAYRIYAVAHGYQARLGPALASITLDRILGLPSLILVVAAGVMLDYQFFWSNSVLSGLLPFISVTGAVCLALVGYLALAGRSRRAAGTGGGGSAAQASANADAEADAPAQSPRSAPANWLRRLHRLLSGNVTRRWTLPLALFYGFASHVACIASCLFFGLALGVEGVPASRYFLIVPLAMAINAIPGSPGGIGQGELAMATLLDLAGPGLGNAQQGVMVMLLFRLTNLAAGILGGAYYALGKKDSPTPDGVPGDGAKGAADGA